jgi:tripartite-type tricarboxylate transporter receptor subunit TctC
MVTLLSFSKAPLIDAQLNTRERTENRMKRCFPLTAFLATLGAFAVCASPAPTAAQFFKGKTLTLMVNYGVGGNADTEARIYQRHLAKHIEGNPTIVVRDVPGAGGFKAMNMLGLNIGQPADGLTAGYFTTSALAPIIDDPNLQVKVYDFQVIGAARGLNIVFARKDIVPGGMTKPADLARAQNIQVGGYSHSTSHDTRLRLVLEVLGLPYNMVTGFPAMANINKAMLQNEVNFTGSSLPGYQTQVIPQLIMPGIAMPLFHYPVIGDDGQPVGNPSLEKQGIATFDKVYQEIHGKPPSGPKWDALLLMSDIGTRMQRGILMHKDTPPEALAALRKAFNALASDEDFKTDYKKITGEEPDLMRSDELSGLFQRMRNIDPVVKKVLQESVGAP